MALDSAASGERGVLLHAAPHQVAVGVSDPSLGWVEVRAERVSGQIAAALTTSSPASHAALISVLPSMATYLQEHQAGVHQVHVETSLAGGQTGTGSNGQASSQNQARTAADNLTAANTASNSWNAAPVRSAAVAIGQRNNYLHEGHFSIRA
jgi:flagellar hook-length control protein FliK